MEWKTLAFLFELTKVGTELLKRCQQKFASLPFHFREFSHGTIFETFSLWEAGNSSQVATSRELVSVLGKLSTSF